VNDLLYVVNEKGIASCIDAKTGKAVWTERLGGKNYWSSPIYASGRVYFFDKEGTGNVIAAGREFKKLATNKLADGYWASPAVSGNALFVRTRTHLYRIEDKE
jgi:hypothetical protein